MNQKSARERISGIISGKRQDLFSRKNECASRSIYINLGAQCNQNCNFCLIKGSEKNFPFMFLNEAKRIIKGFASSGGKSIMFTGGEPTLRDDLPEMIRHAEEWGKLESISIVTNAVRLSDENYFQRLIEVDKQKQLSFGVSFHSHREKVSEEITQSTGTFRKTLKGIARILKSGRPISFYQVITAENYRHLLAFCQFIHKRFPKARSITFAYPFPQGNAVINKRIYVPFDILGPYFIKALNFLEEKEYEINIAACGQFPLCVIPGFEEKVLGPLLMAEENIIGVIGEKVFHEFEWGSEEFINLYKNKSPECARCILNGHCQGFWREYIDQFGFRGLTPVTFSGFKGNKFIAKLKIPADLKFLSQKLKLDKLNVIKLSHWSKEAYRQLLVKMKKEKILAVVIKN